MSKTLRVMRMLMFLLTVTALQVSASGFSQTINFSGEDVPLEKVFKVIKNQTGYSVICSGRLLQRSKPVSVKAVHASLPDFLKMVLEAQLLEYSIENTTVFISGKSTGKIQPGKESRVHVPVVADVDPLRGRVLHPDGQPLEGASIRIKGSKSGTVTDENGYFSIEANAGQVLTISYSGFREKEVRVGAIQSIGDQVLELSDNPLDEVQVIAYGTTSKRLNTGSVATVKAEAIERQPVGNVFNALKGLVPGLDIQQRTGTPGSPIRFNIRGLNSLNGENEPFILVDGVPFAAQTFPAGRNSSLGAFGSVSAFNAINPNDIESIEFLKDADATAIYGSRGANGVILITTKKGKPGKTELNVNVYHGFGKVGRKMELLDTRQYLDMRYEAFANDNVNWRAPNVVANDLKVWDTTRYTNWQDLLIGGTAQYSNAQLGLSGGNQQTNFALSGNYFRETTVYPGDFGNSTASFRLSVNHQSANNRLRISMRGMFAYDFNEVPMVSPMDVALPPVAPEIYDENGLLNWESGTWTNPFAVLQRTSEYATHNLNLSSQISYKILDKLWWKTDFGINRINNENTSLEPLTSISPFSFNPVNSAYVQQNNANSWNIEPYLQFEPIIGAGKITAILGGTFQQRKNEMLGITSSNFSSDALLRTPEAGQNYTLTTSNSLYRYSSFFGRVNYNLLNRYIVNVTARRDGSTRFGPGRQFGNFGAVGMAWIFSEETFIQNTLPFLSFGKLRSSYGITGSDAIGDYSYLPTYSTSWFRSNFGGTPLEPNRLFNSDYAWETNRKADLALELGFNNDNILFTANYYNNFSSNQLVGIPMPAMVGFPTVSGNLNAGVRNTGWEFTLHLVNVRTEDFQWRSSLNLTIPKTRLMSYPNLETSTHANTYRIGQSLSLSRTYDFVQVNPETGVNVYRDMNGKDTSFISSTFFTQSDRVIMVNQVPHFYGGINNSFSYKNFSLDVLFQYSSRTRITNLSTYYGVPGAAVNVPLYVYENSWRNPGQEALFQKFTQATNTPAYRSRITSASEEHYGEVNYLRLNNASLSWQLPTRCLQALHAGSARLYMQGQNLLTFSNFRGEDPEGGIGALPVLRVITFGAQINF